MKTVFQAPADVNSVSLDGEFFQIEDGKLILENAQTWQIESLASHGFSAVPVVEPEPVAEVEQPAPVKKRR